ncbi:SdpI family protein [Ruminococcus sp.]|uniref:SdpI family protein n=1 Tax=Ruminococcus sp. TaxID=41978 RepID=UPI0025DE21ED|nr:SdpI family protein [Ruminococcus sp.]
MNVVIIVNIITSLGIMLGGLCMRKYAKTPLDHSIGFRTVRALSSDEAWRFANEKCGMAWTVIGAVCFVLSVAAVFLFSDNSPAHIAVLIILTAAAVLSAAWVEIQLRKIQ